MIRRLSRDALPRLNMIQLRHSLVEMLFINKLSAASRLQPSTGWYNNWCRDFKIEKISNQSFPKVRLEHKIMVSLYASFYAFILLLLTVLMFNKFTHAREHTFNRRNQDYDRKSSILYPQSKSRTVAYIPTTQC